MASDKPTRVATEEPLLRRLLRRRADEPRAEDPPVAVEGDHDGSVRQPAGIAPDSARATQDEAGPKRDARTGKPVDELTDADLPPLESLGPGSDFSGFLGRNISPALRRRALRQLFHQPQFNTVCLCAEYAENYNNFTALGDIVPHDLTRQLGIQAERAAKKLLAAGQGEADADADADADGLGGAANVRSDEPDGLVQCDTNADATKVVSDSPTPSPGPGKSNGDKP